MKTIILPIIDRRIVIPKSGVFIFEDQSVEEAQKSLEEICGIQVGSFEKLPTATENTNIYFGYCNALFKPIVADLIPPKELLIDILNQDQINVLVQYVAEDKNQSAFTYKDTVSESLPHPQTFTFIHIENTNLFCIVRDGGESHFSLPGGTCELWETSVEGAIREVAEEAQIAIENPILLGVNHAAVVRPDGLCVHEFCQPRYFARIRQDQVQDFVPFKDGFEVEERRFVPFDELPIYIKWLNAENGLPYMEKIRAMLEK
jgi:ADP-ribose pyrophosphatase YjhB (NUDIX family)